MHGLTPAECCPRARPLVPYGCRPLRALLWTPWRGSLIKLFCVRPSGGLDVHDKLNDAAGGRDA
eukprot:1583623-Alexandrium_andersonii.AAC.1